MIALRNYANRNEEGIEDSRYISQKKRGDCARACTVENRSKSLKTKVRQGFFPHARFTVCLSRNKYRGRTSDATISSSIIIPMTTNDYTNDVI